MSKINVDDVRNPLEAGILKQLLAIKKATKYKDLTYEEEKIDYFIPRTYIPDFVIERSDGSKLYIEVKGYLRRDDERKLLAVLRDHPSLDLRILFAQDNRLAGRKMRYSEWCNKNKIPYAIKEIPKEWLIP